MGTTLTGTTPQDTYDSLIKVTDNGPLTGSLKKLTDGLGNDSSLSLSTTAASLSGTLAVTGNATFDTNVLFVDAAANRVGILTTVPTEPLHVEGNISLAYGSSLKAANATYTTLIETGYNGSSDFVSLYSAGNNIGNATAKITMLANGNVGIGTSSPAHKLQVAGAVVNATDVGGTGDAGFQISSGQRLGFDDAGVRSWNAKATGGNLTFTSGDLNGQFQVLTPFSVAQGVKFPATQFSSADANTLDDYEEGTWTMGVSFGGASVGVTYSANTGTYTKIGRQVTVNGNMALTSKGTSTGLARITGLPFIIGSGGSYGAIASVNFENIIFTGQFQPIASVGDTVIVPQFVTELGVNNNTSDANFSDTSRIAINYTYFV
jgi:hypothetical protein